MANEEAEDPKDGETETASEETAPKSKKPLVLGGGIVAVVGLAFALVQVALPKKPTTPPPFKGPFVIPVSEGDIQVNLAKDGGKRFLVMQIQAEYHAYDKAYAAARVADPLYTAKLNDALIRLGRKKSKDDLDNPVGEEVFTAEIRDVIDPLLFPVHVGNETEPTGRHEESGLGPGRAVEHSTLRGGFFSHVIHVDAPAKTLQLDDGPVTPFEGNEDDLVLEDPRGQSVRVDVRLLDPEFVGDVHVGTFGRVDRILFNRLLVQ